MKCPNCNAEVSGRVCEFCGSEVPRPQKNINITNNYYVQSSPKTSRKVDRKPQKRNTWLWVIGWIFIFPLPLTIILLRNKRISSRLKTGIIVLAWIIYLIIAILSYNNKEKNSNNEINTVNNDILIEDSSNEKTADTPKYADDVVVNQFISDYNRISGTEITNIKNGNIRTKYFGYLGGYYTEMINSNSGAISISINFENDTSVEDDVFSVVKNCLTVFGVSDSDSEKTINAFTTENEGDYLIENYSVNSTTIATYCPTKGSMTGHIEIQCTNYK